MIFVQLGKIAVLFAVSTAIAAALTPLQCTANAGVPPIVRVEGVAEAVGEVVIVCTGGFSVPTQDLDIPTINVQIFLNTNLTSRLLGTNSEALLLIDEPTPAEQIEAVSVPNSARFKASGNGTYKNGVRPTVFGAQQASPNSLVWLNIPFDPPGDSGNRTLRISNVRANANQLGLGASLTPSQVSMYISISSTFSFPLNNQQLVVAFIQTGMRFSAAPARYTQCEPGLKSYILNFTELFGASFRHKQSVGDQNTPGNLYNTESMFYSSAFTGLGAGAGIAGQGTRLSARFSNVPSNVVITVPTTGSSTAGDAAILVASGTDGSTANATTGLVTLTRGAGAAVYEITASNPGAISTLSFPVLIYTGIPQPGLGTATVAGNFAPVTATLTASGRESVPRFLEDPQSASTFTIATCGPPPVTLAVNRAALAFTSTTNGAIVTPPQEAFLTMTGASSDWTAVSDSPWLRVTPASGQGNGRMSVFVVPYPFTPPGTLAGKITVNAIGATNGPRVVNCTLTVKSTTAVPFGSFDTPANNLTGVSGSIAVTGWALDDIGVKQVSIWRDRVGPEPVYPNGYVYIGDATFVPGARPDVEGKYSTSPNANRAGWGYMMLTNGLPAKGNGTFKLHAIAVDEEGSSFELGSKTITVDNLHSIKPFGAIDNPAPGQVISGTIVNDGWALSPQPALLAADGSTIWVNIDGVNVAHPAYGMLRNDVASLFPGYANSSGSLGQYSLDSTLYTNAMHSIAWIVYDNLGHGDGMGSRFFHILNAGGASAGSAPAAPAVADAERAFRLRAARLARPVAAVASYPAVRLGFDLDAPLTPIRQGGEGLLEPIELKELDRMEIHLPGGQKWSAGMRVGDELRELPVGSTFDADGGIFYWQLAPGFLGEYVLEFHAEDGPVLPVPVRVGLE